MGGVEEEKAKATEYSKDQEKQKLGFDEDDQAALYMQVSQSSYSPLGAPLLIKSKSLNYIATKFV